MTTYPDIVRVLTQRADTGMSYKNQALEQKRIRAIIYLRTESKVGWLRDHPLGKRHL